MVLLHLNCKYIFTSFFLSLCYEVNVLAFKIYILLILDLIQEDSCLSNQHLFNYNFLAFLQPKQIQFFVSHSDTTGVTQLLDQLNKNMRQEYEKEKAAIFKDFNSLNREAFMLILAKIWDKLVSKEILWNSARKVGVTGAQLSVDLMRQNKFDMATGFLIEGSLVQNHWVAPRSTQPFILLTLGNCVRGTPGNLLVRSKLPPRSGSISLRQLIPIHEKSL